MEATWKTAAPETYLNVYKRSWDPKMKVDRNKPDNNYAMTFKTGTGVYKTYKECYNKVVSKLTDSDKSSKNNKYMKKGMKEFKKGGWDFLADLEKSTKCAGVCVTPLFYLTRPLAEGPPKIDCVRQFTKKFDNNIYLAATAFITSLTLICAGLCGLALCGDYNKPEE